MTGNAEIDDSADTNLNVNVTCKLIRTINKKIKAQRKKGSITTKQDTKVKAFDFAFASTQENYTEFLKTMLKKHGVDTKSEPSDTRTFSFKIHVPPGKVTEAPDVEDYEEYLGIIKYIREQRKPVKNVTVTFNEAKAQLALSKGKKKLFLDLDGSESNEGSQDGKDDSMSEDLGLSKMDHELARLRLLLEKKYANDRGGGYAYIDLVSAETMSLSPFMMKEWARAMYDGKATVEVPPLSTTFDMVNRKAALRDRSKSSSSGSSETGSSDLAHISNILSCFMNRPQTSAQPQTPERPIIQPNNSLPPVNSPTKLTRFLEFAKTALGIPDALSYEAKLHEKGVGPNILHRISQESLIEIGISLGNAIRLQDAAPQWWKSSNAKQPKHKPSTRQEATPPNKRVRFEKHYHDRGKFVTWGSKLVPFDFDDDALAAMDFDWHYYSSEHESVVPVPKGFVPIFEDD